MRIHPRIATCVAALTFSLCSVPVAFAATGGGTTVAGGSSSDAPAAAAASADGKDPILTRTVKLTSSQTKSVQRRVKVKADGALGNGTRKAIKRYQRVQTLTLTGAPNVETLRSMKLKVADKIEAQLRAEDSGGGTGVETTTVSAPASTVDAILTAARSAIGTPYKSAGTTLAGFDCSGFTLWAFKQAGINLPRTSFQQYGEGNAVSQDAIEPGDLVFFDSAGSGASHVGIATSATKAISATSHGVMEHTFASGYWAGHYVGARRVSAAVKAVFAP